MNSLYRDIEARTNGEIYMGVVGPVRTGKSTFIRRFMELMVIPKIEDENARIRATDELPQASNGRTIMTTEPKFIPKDAVKISVSAYEADTQEAKLSIRMVDCVGYMVKGAEGHMEDGHDRMVMTPWDKNEIPFVKAAEIGTRKVISDHSTIGIVVTTDGTVTDIARDSYIEAEERTIKELSQLGKPYVVILNTQKPKSVEALRLSDEMTAKYNTRVLPINIDQLKISDVNRIFEEVLKSFPVTEIVFKLPEWIAIMKDDSEIKQSIFSSARELLGRINLMGDLQQSFEGDGEFISNIASTGASMDSGRAEITYRIHEDYYFSMLSELFGKTIEDEAAFYREIKSLSETRRGAALIKDAFESAERSGYGTVVPDISDIRLDEPVVIKNGNKYGVRLHATAPSFHLIRANVETEIAPIVGTMDQAKDLIEYIKSETGDEPEKIWDVNIFGKTISNLVSDGMNQKITKITEESTRKLQDTMEKIVNDSNGGMVCIII